MSVSTNLFTTVHVYLIVLAADLQQRGQFEWGQRGKGRLCSYHTSTQSSWIFIYMYIYTSFSSFHFCWCCQQLFEQINCTDLLTPCHESILPIPSDLLSVLFFLSFSLPLFQWEVRVRVHDTRLGQVTYWTQAKLESRLEQMRELYQSKKEAISPTEQGTEVSLHYFLYTLRVQLFASTCTFFCDFCDWRGKCKIKYLI